MDAVGLFAGRYATVLHSGGNPDMQLARHRDKMLRVDAPVVFAEMM
jgi:hypothetical protein